MLTILGPRHHHCDRQSRRDFLKIGGLALGGLSALGAAVSRLQGPAHPAVPPFVGLSPRMITSTWADSGQPGFLGMAHAAFKPNVDGLADMVLRGISLEQLADRRALLSSFD